MEQKSDRSQGRSLFLLVRLLGGAVAAFTSQSPGVYPEARRPVPEVRNGKRSCGVTCLKLLIAIIQPTKLNAVKEALAKIGVERMTVCDAQGYGRQRGRTEMYRGLEYKTNLLRKISLEIMLNDDFVERTIEVITSVARTGPDGTIGDGKIFVMPAEETIQISEPVRGPGAI